MVSNLREVLLHLHDTPRKGDWKGEQWWYQTWGRFYYIFMTHQGKGTERNTVMVSNLGEIVWHLHDVPRKGDWKGTVMVSNWGRFYGIFMTHKGKWTERGTVMVSNLWEVLLHLHDAPRKGDWKEHSDGIKLIKEIPLGHHDTKRRRTDRNVQSKMI